MSDPVPGSRLRPGALAELLALTFAITWGVALVAVLAPGLPDPAATVLFWVAVAGPGLAAAVVVGRRGGRAGLRAWVRVWTHWRVPWRWWCVPLVGIPALGVAARAVEALLGGRSFELTPALLLPLSLALPASLPVDPGWTEEPGWRGLALPLLLRRWGWRGATAALATVTTVWHVPAWFVAGTAQQGLDFLAFVLFHWSCAVLMTALVTRTGSVLVGGLLVHQAANTLGAAPLDVDLLLAGALLAAVAVVVLLAHRPGRARTTAWAHGVLAPLGGAAAPPPDVVHREPGAGAQHPAHSRHDR